MKASSSASASFLISAVQISCSAHCTGSLLLALVQLVEDVRGLSCAPNGVVALLGILSRVRHRTDGDVGDDGRTQLLFLSGVAPMTTRNHCALSSRCIC